MAQAERVDLCIIGAGAAGLAAAERGRALGASVMLIEAVQTGGVAQNWGALPAQALSAAAARAHQIRHAKDLGLGADEPRINFARLNARLRSVVERAIPETAPERLAALGIESVRGTAVFSGPQTVRVGERTIAARHFIVATGSRPLIPDIPGIDTVPYLTPETIFELTRKPAHLVVVGGGATGVALAQSHLRLGCAVTLIDMLEPLGDEDAELAAIVLRRLRAEGMVIHANTGVISVAGGEDRVSLEVKSGAEERTIAASHLLFATGRSPNLAGLGIEAARVRLSPAGPQIDAHGRTSNRRIYCVGDAVHAGTVHAARRQAEMAVDHALSGPWRRGGVALVPQVIHTDPALARVGATEAMARQRYKTGFSITRFPFAAITRAQALGETEGQVKMLTRADGRIIGASIVGPQAGELISIFALAIAWRLTPGHLEQLVVPHPALAEIVSAVAAEYRHSHGPKGGTGPLGALKRLLP